MSIFDRFRRSRGEALSAGPQVTGDVGPQVIDFVFSSMRVDTRWSLREPRGFTWWGHRFAQRVWADPVRASHGYETVQVHATTAVLRGAPDSPETRQQLALLNRYASLSAFIWSPEQGRVLLHSAAVFHSENVGWLKALFLAAAGLQVADAHIKADGLAKILGGEPDASAHPRHGPRPEPDEILEIIATTFAPAGADRSPFTEADFVAAAEMTPRPWVMVSSNATGLTGQFPFTGSVPAGLADTVETALLNATNDQRHPQLGSGALLTLRLPISLGHDQAVAVASALNQVEARVPTGTHALGAWTTVPVPPEGPPTLAFCCFIPALMHRPGLLAAMTMAMAARTRWVADLYVQGKAPTSRSLEDFERMVRAAESPAGLADLQRAVSAGLDALRFEAEQTGRDQQGLKDMWHQRPSAPEVRCWSCKELLPLAPETRGKEIRCPRCRTKQELPR